MTKDTPESYEDLESNRETYEHRLAEWNYQGSSSMGSNVLLPDEDASPMAYEAFHRLMTECGMDGIEYAQEALHGEGGDYFDEMFESVEGVMEDYRRAREFL